MRTRRWLPIVLFSLATGCGYNRIVNEEQQVEAAWGQVENQLQRRADLIPNLVETVKGYASHEKSVFDNIANARAAMVGAGSRADKIAASNQLDAAISRLLVVTENYPQLKADANFQRLMDELAGTENRLAVARNRYNEAVQEYNTDMRGIPGAGRATSGGWGPCECFNAESGAGGVRRVRVAERGGMRYRG